MPCADTTLVVNCTDRSLTLMHNTMTTPERLAFRQALAIAEHARFGRGKSIILYNDVCALVGQYSKAEVDAVDPRLIPVLKFIRADHHPQYDDGSALTLRATLQHWTTGPLLTLVKIGATHYLMAIKSLSLEHSRHEGDIEVKLRARRYMTFTMEEGYQGASPMDTGTYRCPPRMLETLYPGCCDRITLALDIGMTLEEAAAYVFDNQPALDAAPATLPEGLLPSM